MLVYCHRPSTPGRPAIPPEPRDRYLASNAVPNRANTLARRKINPEAQPKGKPIPINGTKTSGSQNPQDSPLSLEGWSSSSSDVSDDFDSHSSRLVTMTSPVDQGGNSTGRRIALLIKPQGMLNTYRIMKKLWSPKHDDKAQKCKAQFDVDNWEERRFKMHCLEASAKEFLKEDQLEKR